MSDFDAVVVGAGPNGLAGAVILARAGLRVAVLEREATIGGGARTAELTLPGFLSDICSAVHPMALASPFFREFELANRIDLRVPELSYAHPLDGGAAGLAFRDLDRTVGALGGDGPAWRRLLAPLVARAREISEVTGTSLMRVPSHPFTLARLGLRALEQGSGSWGARFGGELAPAMLTGAFAHANRRLPDVSAAAAGLVLATHAHAAGWPIPVGGSQAIVDAMAADIVDHGGVITTGVEIESLAELPSATALLLDVTPRALVRLAGGSLPVAYARRLTRFRYGAAVAKVDFALDGPVPWTNPEVSSAGTLHLGGSRAEIAAAEGEVASGRVPESPTCWCPSPPRRMPVALQRESRCSGRTPTCPRARRSTGRRRSPAQIERFAPGFRDRILGVSSQSAVDVESHNPNYIGGDISSGTVSLAQLLARPRAIDPWATPLRGVYLCSGSTSPGPGVHGMGGWNAARRALLREFGIRSAPNLGISAG